MYSHAIVAAENGAHLSPVSFVPPEFLPGPWSVEVDVEFYRDVLRPMGVGVRLHLKDNLSVTLPPLRVLPFNSGKLSTEQWLLLELAELHTQRQWQSNSEDETESTEKDKPGEWATFQRDAAFEALSVGRCRLKRGRRADDPVLLDCLPNISNRSKREREQWQEGALCTAFICSSSAASIHVRLCFFLALFVSGCFLPHLCSCLLCSICFNFIFFFVWLSPCIEANSVGLHACVQNFL